MRALTIFSLLCVLATAYGQSHDLNIGQATFGDVVIYKANEYKYGFPFVVRSSIIDFPEQGQQNYAVIRAIYVKDHDTDGSGGYPIMAAGGVGQRFLRLKLKSQRGGGFNFTVTIYGRYS